MITFVYDPILGAQYIFDPIKENRNWRRSKKTKNFNFK